jgi:hypothetical protein
LAVTAYSPDSGSGARATIGDGSADGEPTGTGETAGAAAGPPLGLLDAPAWPAPGAGLGLGAGPPGVGRCCEAAAGVGGALDGPLHADSTIATTSVAAVRDRTRREDCMRASRSRNACASRGPGQPPLAQCYEDLISRLMIVGQTEAMATPGAGFLLRRVGARAGLGLWRHRGGLVFAALITVALGGYTLLGSSGSLPPALSSPAAGSTDCADTAMAAIADKSSAAAQRAYACMDPGFQQRVSEDQFVSQLVAQQTPPADKLQRVGDYHDATNGSTLVYFAVDGGGQSVGYIVYLNRDGKVLKIE